MADGLGQGGDAGWARSGIVRLWLVIAVLAGASVGVAFAATQRASINRFVVLHVLPGADGMLTEQQCAEVPREATYAQVLTAYGWPKHVPGSQRGQWSLQVTNGGEMDYPVRGGPNTGFVRFCAVVFVGGKVDHQWEDLP